VLSNACPPLFITVVLPLAIIPAPLCSITSALPCSSLMSCPTLWHYPCPSLLSIACPALFITAVLPLAIIPAPPYPLTTNLLCSSLSTCPLPLSLPLFALKRPPFLIHHCRLAPCHYPFPSLLSIACPALFITAVFPLAIIPAPPYSLTPILLCSSLSSCPFSLVVPAPLFPLSHALPCSSPPSGLLP